MGSERSKIIFPVVLPVFTLSILVIKKGFGTLEAILLTSWFGHLPIFAAEVGNLPEMPVCRMCLVDHRGVCLIMLYGFHNIPMVVASQDITYLAPKIPKSL